MKYPVKIFKVKCDYPKCDQEIHDFEDYKNTCFICHKDFCDEHIWLYQNTKDESDYIAICKNCFEKLAQEFEEHLDSEQKILKEKR